AASPSSRASTQDRLLAERDHRPAPGRVGDQAEAAVDRKRPADQAEPAAGMAERRRRHDAAEPEQKEGDPERQEDQEQDARQLEGRDPQIERKKTPEQQRDPD